MGLIVFSVFLRLKSIFFSNLSKTLRQFSNCSHNINSTDKDLISFGPVDWCPSEDKFKFLHNILPKINCSQNLISLIVIKKFN